MKKLWVFGLVALLLVGVAAAESCFTAVNVPQANKYYWKAITYTGIQDGNYDSFLTKQSSPNVTPSIGPGYQFIMRLDNNCFESHLLGNKDSTGMISSQINIEKIFEDYTTPDFIQNKLYTVSIQNNDDVSTRIVNQIGTGTINSVNYLALPASFNDVNNHPLVRELTNAGLCNPTLKITRQMDEIKLAVWEKIEPSDDVITCTSQNKVDCTLEQAKGDSEDYAALNMVLGRICGVPTRVVRGISEGNFDGVDISFERQKEHYWIEFYDNGWFEKEVTEGGLSLPLGIETNCQDNIDNDQDGNIDCWDEMCSDSSVCSSWVETTVFDNEYSTDLESLPNAYNIDDLTIGNEHGSVTWTNKGLDLRGYTIETAVSIAPGVININNQIPALDTAALGVLNNIVGVSPKILLNNLVCDACTVTNYAGGVLNFNIIGKGVYTVAFSDAINQTAPPVIIGSPKPKLFSNPFKWIESQWNELTWLGKIALIAIVVGLLWLWKKRRDKQRGRY